eukprot:4691255-Prorocentrum_lima.AAC.1
MIQIGGRACDADDGFVKETAEHNVQENIEPIFYHIFPTTLYEDTGQTFELKAVIEFTPGDGSLA